MHTGRGSGNLLEQVEILFTAGTAVGLTDRDLLERFLSEGRESGEAAFTVLVKRHGPMVLRVCNQALRNRHAAEDAFQATFLVLARQAGSIRRRDSLESWLFGVALRAAAQIRMAEARRQRYERRGAKVRAERTTQTPDLSGSWPELHAAISLLPEKYRVPTVLCYFESLTHEQAAARLGWPVGTVKTRLARARERLRWRLERRGFTTSMLIPAEHFQRGDLAAVPQFLLDSTTQAAARFVPGAVVGEFLSPSVLAISRGVLNAMLINKLRLAAITLFGVATLGLGALALARQARGERQDGGQPVSVSKTASDSPRPTVLDLNGSTDFVPESVVRIQPPFDCRVDRVLVDLGSKVAVGDPLLELFSADLAAARTNYEAAKSQWLRDKKVLDYKTPLAVTNNISRKELIEGENDEAQSRLKMRLARNKLSVYGLTKAEIENPKDQDDVSTAKMILRSRAVGVVVQRSVVAGNFYDAKETLLVIAGLDTLWVRAAVDPRDAGSLELGQRITVTFPFSNKTLNTTVQFISREAEAKTGQVMIRASIPNPEHRWKAGMFVRLGIEQLPTMRSSKIGDARSPQRHNVSLEDRLSEVERKLERLLDEKASRSTNEEILRRLSELERKLDRVLDRSTGK